MDVRDAALRWPRLLCSPEVAALAACQQTRRFHAEGSVLAHSLMAWEEARSTEVSSELPAGLEREVLELASFLHDIGKPVVSQEAEPGVWMSHGHAVAGSSLVARLWLRGDLPGLPLGALEALQALVGAHMWTFGIDDVRTSDLLRLSHSVDPSLLVGLWRADTRGRLCDDAAGLEDQVDYAEEVLRESAPSASHLPFGIEAGAEGVRHVLRAARNGLEEGSLRAALARSRAPGRGSLTYTFGLPGAGKSTWSQRWQDASGGVALTARGNRRRDRQAAALEVHTEAVRLLGKGADVLVDATHLNRESRAVVVALGERYEVPLRAVHVRADLATSKARQRVRSYQEAVPDRVLDAMADKFEWPGRDEYDTLSVVEPTRTWEYDQGSRWRGGGPWT